MLSAGSDWSVVAAARRERIYGDIPKAWLLNTQEYHDVPPIEVPRRCGHLTNNELRLTELRAVDIVEAVRNYQLTAAEVMLAFCKRATIAHQLVSMPWCPNEGSVRQLCTC